MLDSVCAKCKKPFDLEEHGPVTGMCGHTVCEECGNPEKKEPDPWYHATLHGNCPTCGYWDSFVGASKNWCLREFIARELQFESEKKMLTEENESLKLERKADATVIEYFKEEKEKASAERDAIKRDYLSELENSQRKTIQLDKIDQQINSLKEGVSKSSIDTFEEVSEKETALSAEAESNGFGDMQLLSVVWNGFKTNMDKLHQTMSTLLKQCVESQDSVFRSSALETSKKMNEVLFEVRTAMYTATEQCIVKLQACLDSTSEIIAEQKEHVAETNMLD